MNSNDWKRLLLSCVAVAVLASQVFAGAVLTEDQALKISKDIEVLSNARDVDGVLKYLAPDVILTMNVHSSSIPGGVQTVTLDRVQYEESLRQAWGSAEEYSYKQSDEKVVIQDEGQTAVVSCKIHERVVMGGVAQDNDTEEVSTIRMIDGKPLVTKVVADVHLPN